MKCETIESDMKVRAVLQIPVYPYQQEQYAVAKYTGRYLLSITFLKDGIS